MPRFGMRRISSILAAGCLATAGCLAAAIPAHAAGTLSLLILPDQGENAIYNFVSSATSSIDVTIYEFKDTALVNALVSREKAGVNVRVLLDQAHKSYDSAAATALTAGGVSVAYSSTAFTYTHQKTITVDNKESYISTGNFDTTYYATSRDYGVFDTDAADVAAIVAGSMDAIKSHHKVEAIGAGDGLGWNLHESYPVSDASAGCFALALASEAASMSNPVK